MGIPNLFGRQRRCHIIHLLLLLTDLLIVVVVLLLLPLLPVFLIKGYRVQGESTHVRLLVEACCEDERKLSMKWYNAMV